MLSPAAVERFITKFLDRVKSRLGSDQAAQ